MCFADLTNKIRADAVRWIVQMERLATTGEDESAWPDFLIWLRQDPRHRTAIRQLQNLSMLLESARGQEILRSVTPNLSDTLPPDLAESRRQARAALHERIRRELESQATSRGS